MTWTTMRTMTAIAMAMGLTACSDDGITPGQTGTTATTGSVATGASGGVETSADTSVATGEGTANPEGTSGSDGTGAVATEGASSSGSGGTGTSSGGGDTTEGTSSSSGGESSSDDGPMCQEMGMSCAMAETCCPGLNCCAGVPVPPGMEFCSGMCPISDYNRKRDFEAVDASEVLDKVAALPITSWSYRFEDAAIRHIGPMAQDFMASFDVGASDKSIFVIDADGVSLVAIQALYRRLQTAEADNAELRETVDDLERRLLALEAR